VKILVHTLSLTIFSLSFAFGQAGVLDATFGSNGIDSLVHGVGNSVAIQADGKILVVGTDTDNKYNNIALARFNINGSLDSTFGINGISKTVIGKYGAKGSNVALQPDGKILVCGQAGANWNFSLFRFNANGTIDTTFGSKGFDTTFLEVASQDFANSVIVQPDGKIILSGYLWFNYGNYFALVRYNADGSLDAAFGNNGIVITVSKAHYGISSAAALQSDGKIIQTGYFSLPGKTCFGLVRYNVNGSLDTAFGNRGIDSTFIDTASNMSQAIAIEPDNKILVAGTAGNLDYKFALVRFNTDGSLDNTFGINGAITTDFGNGAIANAIALQADGKIVLAGLANTKTANEFGIARYNNNGTPDTTFGKQGKLMTIVPSRPMRNQYILNAIANSVALQADNKIVVSGTVSNYLGDDFVLVRYLNDLTLGVINFSSPNNSAFIYPNPINNSAVLKYSLYESENITINLFDVNGKLVKTFISNQNQSKGNYTEQLNFDSNISAGNYFLAISNSKQKETVKIIKQ
jgi:uncharacterized delta-60 repeat protein